MTSHLIYDNSFFRLLQTDYAKSFSEAQINRWTVVVPLEGTFCPHKVDSSFVGYHILKRSPLYADHFVTRGTKDSKATLIEWDRDLNVLRTINGFPHDKHVCIVAEEEAYNEAWKPYQIVLICEPLHTAPNKCVDYHPHTKKSRDHPKQSTQMDWPPTNVPLDYVGAKRFLKNNPDFVELLPVIDEKIDSFNKNYVIVPKFINDAVDRIRGIADTASQLLSSSGADQEKLAECIENYVSGQAHHKVFGAVKDICKLSDADLERRLEFLRLSNVSAAMLGVEVEHFQCELPESIVELASLNAKYTPLDKLWCLRRTLTSIQTEVESHILNSQPDFVGFGKESSCAVTTELLILLSVVVLCRSRPMDFASNLFYIDHFCGVKDDFSCFTLSTFKAAAEFVRNYKGTQKEHLSPGVLRKELSLVDLMEVTAHINEGFDKKLDKDGTEDGSSKTSGRSNAVDSKLEQITRLIEKQTLDFHLKEEEQLRRRLEQNEPRASSLNSSATSVDSSEDGPAGAGSLLFSPLSSLRRSLRGQSKYS